MTLCKKKAKLKKKKFSVLNGLSLITGFDVRPSDCAPQCVRLPLAVRWLVLDW